MHPKCKGLFNNIYQSSERESFRNINFDHEPEGDLSLLPGTENIGISNLNNHFPSNGFDLKIMVFYDKKFLAAHGNDASRAKNEAEKLLAHAEQIYALETANDICDHLTMPKIYFDVQGYEDLDFDIPYEIFKYFYVSNNTYFSIHLFLLLLTQKISG